MGFFATSLAWLFLLIPPLVVLYFLRLKRPRVEVPSLALWKQVMQDQRVNSPFQKFKRHILLLLQLLLLALLILAAMQPYMRGGAEQAVYRPILIDHSASMAALDRPGGVSRLDAAKQQVRELIADLPSDQQVAIIAFADSARRLTPFTDNKRLLMDALDDLEVHDVPSRLDEALRLMQALAQRTPFESVLLLSDGNLPADVDFALPFELRFQKLEPGGPNVGVTALSARCGEAGQWEVFVSLASSTEEPQSGTVRVFLNDDPAGEQFVSVAAGDGERILFPVQVSSPTRITAEFAPDGFDALSSDNRAFVHLDPARPVAVYCPPDMLPYRMALAANPAVQLYPDASGATRPAYDLVVTDQPADLELLAPVVMTAGIVPEPIAQLVERDDAGNTVVDWRRDDPLLRHVNLAELVLLDDVRTVPDVTESDFENLGYEVLVHGEHGPLVLRRREGDLWQYHLLFDTGRSTLVYRVGFPVMLTNLVRQAMHRAGLLEVSGNAVGVLPVLTEVDPGATVTAVGPDGASSEATADEQGVVRGLAGPRAGVYRIHGAGVEREIGLSLLSPDETALRQVEEIRFSELSVAAASSDVAVDRSLWRYFAMVGFGVLLIEWWFYQRRPGPLRVPGGQA